MSTATLTLLGSGKMLLSTDGVIDAEQARALQNTFKDWSADPKALMAILGMPVTVIDNSKPSDAPTLDVQNHKGDSG